MVERRFPRAVGSLDAIFAFIGDFVDARGLDPELKYDVGLAAEELFTNLVKYGRGEQRDICMALDAEPDRLVLVIQDFDADPFDVTQAEPPSFDAPPSERRRGGLGIHLVKQITDELRYEYANRTSTITVIKRLKA